MAIEWRVETERLLSSANKIEESTNNYNLKYNHIYELVQDLRSDKWQGIASDTFNERLEGYRNDFQEMEKILKNYAEFLRTAAKNYSDTEEAVRNEASRLYTGK